MSFSAKGLRGRRGGGLLPTLGNGHANGSRQDVPLVPLGLLQQGGTCGTWLKGAGGTLPDSGAAGTTPALSSHTSDSADDCVFVHSLGDAGRIDSRDMLGSAVSGCNTAAGNKSSGGSTSLLQQQQQETAGMVEDEMDDGDAQAAETMLALAGSVTGSAPQLWQPSPDQHRHHQHQQKLPQAKRQALQPAAAQLSVHLKHVPLQRLQQQTQPGRPQQCDQSVLLQQFQQPQQYSRTVLSQQYESPPFPQKSQPQLLQQQQGQPPFQQQHFSGLLQQHIPTPQQQQQQQQPLPPLSPPTLWSHLLPASHSAPKQEA